MPLTRSPFPSSILRHDRIVVSPSLRDQVFHTFHSAHQGSSQMCSCAEISFFWPGMTVAIIEMRSRYQPSNHMAPFQPCTHPPHIPPMNRAYSFQCIVANYLYYKGHSYLVAVDRFNNWPVVQEAAHGAT
ncbi:retrovirus-related pol polyprotein from [Plakobranchus ocellatus]|uniref:Retrovirus-related pol polyprotein from n=1 Tax=Plakobranchus ocellatus TaxID=259542 RepID=A0AAV4DAC2_9GAST|nr:retrovirus-related pol polyprotein from [Plakobranchus ocellatus]